MSARSEVQVQLASQRQEAKSASLGYVEPIVVEESRLTAVAGSAKVSNVS